MHIAQQGGGGDCTTHGAPLKARGEIEASEKSAALGDFHAVSAFTSTAMKRVYGWRRH
jgi:hypothetical protein